MPAEAAKQRRLERAMGIEPTTLSLGSLDVFNKSNNVLAKLLLSDIKCVK